MIMDVAHSRFLIPLIRVLEEGVDGLVAVDGRVTVRLPFVFESFELSDQLLFCSLVFQPVWDLR